MYEPPKLQVMSVPLAEINPAPYNPRTIEDRKFQALQKSIETFDMVQPLVVNRRNMILISGHQRYKVLETHGEIHADVLFVDLDEKQEKALNITMNNPELQGEFDLPGLHDLLQQLADFPQFEELGLPQLQLEKFPSPNEDQSYDPLTDDQLPPQSSDIVIQAGDLIHLGKHRVLCGDNGEKKKKNALFQSEMFSILFTSPPYAQQREYTQKIDDWTQLMQNCFSDLPICENSQIFVNLGLVYREEVQEYWEDWKLWMREKYCLFGWYTWDQGSGLPGDWSGRLAPSFEFIFHFNQQKKTLHKVIPKKTKNIGKKHHYGLREPDGSIPKRGKRASTHIHKIPDSVIRINRYNLGHAEKLDHPAIFPMALPQLFIETYTDENDIVFDPFLGSGTTLIACESTGRVCYGMEISPQYCQTIIDRWCLYTRETKIQINEREIDWNEYKESALIQAS